MFRITRAAAWPSAPSKGSWPSARAPARRSFTPFIESMLRAWLTEKLIKRQSYDRTQSSPRPQPSPATKLVRLRRRAPGAVRRPPGSLSLDPPPPPLEDHRFRLRLRDRRLDRLRAADAGLRIHGYGGYRPAGGVRHHRPGRRAGPPERRRPVSGDSGQADSVGFGVAARSATVPSSRS